MVAKLPKGESGSSMKVLVVGCGSIGERHIRNLKSFLEGSIVACDLDEEKLTHIGKKYDVEICMNYDEVLSKDVDCVLVCTPTNTHVDLAKKALIAGCHVFVEKPLSNKLEGIDELIRLGKERNRIIFVGFNLRFNKCLRKIKEWLYAGEIGKVVSVRAHFGYSFLQRKVGTDYREDYAGRESMGGGVIFDAIHEIDYLRWLFGEIDEVFCYSDKLSQLNIDVEDLAEMLFKFRSGIIGSVHLDFIQLPYCRSCKIIGCEGTIEWNLGTIEQNFVDGIARLYSLKSGNWQTCQGEDWNVMYLEEIKHFIKCMEGEEKPPVGAELGKKILEVALAAKKSSKDRKIIRIRDAE
jgi:predicted dehydrogenase